MREARRVVLIAAFVVFTAGLAAAQPPAPQLTGPVNDFANVIDPQSAAELTRRINALTAASGDVVVVATVPTIEGYYDINEYRVKMFENGGRGIGQKGKDNGLLIVVAIAERQVGIEIGYDLEGIITDGTAGSVIRERIRPEFRNGNYGAGLVNGTTALINLIARGRGVQLSDVPAAAAPRRPNADVGLPAFWPFILMIIIIMLMNRGKGRRRRRWGGGG
nr:TPM domain-containing protein [Acidobacteriota bacterium]